MAGPPHSPFSFALDSLALDTLRPIGVSDEEFQEALGNRLKAAYFRSPEAMQVVTCAGCPCLTYNPAGSPFCGMRLQQLRRKAGSFQVAEVELTATEADGNEPTPDWCPLASNTVILQKLKSELAFKILKPRNKLGDPLADRMRRRRAAKEQQR